VKASRGKYLVLPFLFCILFFFCATPAFSSTIVFGNAFGPTDTATNVPDDINPAGVDVLMKFAVDIPNSQVSLTITNDQTSMYAVRSAYFNTTDNISTLTLNETATDQPAWDLWNTFNETKRADGFGLFDWQLKDGNVKDVGIGESFTWVFDVTYTGTLSDLDFNSAGSVTNSNTKDDKAGWIGAVHAVNGKSGFAATHTTTVIPEPASLILLGTGVVGLLGLRRKMKN